MNETNISNHQLPAGTLLNDKYEIIRTLGEGGFGITYLGHNKVLDIPVAIKEYFPQGYAVRTVTQNLTVTITDKTKNSYFSEWKLKFLAEARMLAKFAHLPGIVNVYDFFEQNGTAYIIMEYLDGITLKNYVEEKGPMDTSTFFKRLIPVLTSLEKIHKNGHIHRDISPDNLMLMDDGFLKLFDFGAAREYSDATQSNFSVIIKPGFAPEEQYRSKGDQRAWTDVYSICATIYFSISGIVPDDSLQRAYKDELKKPSELGVNITPKIERVLLKGMNVRSVDRFDTVRPLIEAFEEADIKPKKSLIKEKKPKEKKTPSIFPFFLSSKQVESTSAPAVASTSAPAFKSTPGSKPVTVSNVDKTEIIPNTEFDPIGDNDNSYNPIDNEIKRRPKPEPANELLPSPAETGNVINNQQSVPDNNISASENKSEQIVQSVQAAPEKIPEQINSVNNAIPDNNIAAENKPENNTQPDIQTNEKQITGIACPKCRTVLPSTAKFCGICGIPLISVKNPVNNNASAAANNKTDNATLSDAQKNQENKTGIVCPKCKAILPKGAKFCGKCGLPLSPLTTKPGA